MEHFGIVRSVRDTAYELFRSRPGNRRDYLSVRKSIERGSHSHQATFQVGFRSYSGANGHEVGAVLRALNSKGQRSHPSRDGAEDEVTSIARTVQGNAFRRNRSGSAFKEN